MVCRTTRQNMASIVRVAARKCIRPILSHNKLAAPSACRAKGYWNYEWEPGPFPTTPAQRAAAAKKYGLREEDYEPYPDDGFGHGDYPKLPRVSADSRSYHDTWDDPSNRRNFGEPMHVDSDALVAHYWDPTTYESRRISLSQIRNLFILGIGTYVLIFWLLQPYKLVQPALPKQFPRDLKPGEKHYTFEPAE
ncbi:hypothetical protein CAPTEDRAFT_165694 [Capitella teleta]|uniref:NADH dehydrogenase [ubiquinone] 1 beta subcomplex subunit 8, mitochondrial n=1 Tax=Capitella teleta TaxID=283909 RepID=X1ZAF5_CAPTE|nr:hypothetical protein CAPTEDRAFT_165694 [Capitella teleta]|eukprot:ELU00351.1 hypothetical protein CAPTEDRAFT_165694 [Capitella teleta]